MSRAKKLLFLLLCLLMISETVSTANAATTPTAFPTFPNVGSLQPIYELPNLFKFNDGSMVETAADWTSRRAEIANMLQYYEYGYTQRPDTLVATRTGNTLNVTMTKEYPNPDDQAAPIVKTTTFSVAFTLPTKENLDTIGQSFPVPAFIGGGPTGYQAKGYASIPWPGNTNVGNNANYTGTYYDLFPYDPDSVEFNTGKLIASAWAASRVIDALEWRDPVTGKGLFPEIDETQMISAGFSQNGKRALLAGAFDERMGMAYVQHSGQWGASSLRFTHDSKKYPAGNNNTYTNYTADEMDPSSLYSARTGLRKEQMSQNQGSYVAWFSSRVQQFTNANKYDYPLDHHALIALMAPRPVMITEGMDDFWNGPESVAISTAGAKPVFELLGASQNLGLVISPKTRHAQTNLETASAFAMADMNFRGIAPTFTDYRGNDIATQSVVPRDFTFHPFEIDPTAIPWSVPGQYGVATVNKRDFVEGLPVTIPVVSDASAVTIKDPDGKVLSTQNVVNGKASFELAPNQTKAGYYTITASGAEKRSRDIKIECMTLEYMFRPEILLESEENTWHWAFPEKINPDTIRVSFDSRSYEELKKDIHNASANVNAPSTEYSLEIQNYGVMIRRFGRDYKAGQARYFDEAQGKMVTAKFDPVKVIHIDGIEFPDVLPGYTFSLTMDIPDDLNN
ncbi:hypothetical protein ACFOLF_25730 [Paenibacillus sepulcri]|uniref:4-O-methyl-glucuronoyl methylesterase-like domain-containing protein n=1 Tax=Paenibacillus sepulcri TaxID=359917 RepID=A0ABS7BWS4_9BACL|nr:hypothetical protein [Paenibacillus sepulcri]